MKEKQNKTVRVNDAVTAFRLINPAKLTKMETAERFAIILATRPLKKIDADFQDLVKDAQEKLKPEGFDAIVEKVQAKKELTAEEQAVLNKYNKDVADCVQSELDKELTLDFAPLSEDALGRFIESNDFNVSEIMLLQEILA